MGLMDESFKSSLPFDIVHYSALPLSKQCSVLDIDLFLSTMRFRGKPEPAVMRDFGKYGYECRHCEGEYFFSIIHALILDSLEIYNSANAGSRRLAASRPLKLQIQETCGLHDLIFKDILTANAVQFKNNLEDILGEKQYYKGYPEAYIEFTQQIMGHVDREALLGLAYMLASDPVKLFRGWPDLVVMNEDTMRLVEVKCGDKLTVNQLYTIYHLKKWFNNIEVMALGKLFRRLYENEILMNELRLARWKQAKARIDAKSANSPT